MSFVSLLDNVVFSETDILNRTEAMVREYFSLEQETILNRKLQGATLGVYTLTQDDLAEVVRFNTVVTEAHATGLQARLDNSLKMSAMEYERATERLNRYILSVGRQSQDILDEEGNVVGTTPAIDPLPLTITAEDGTIIPNPLIEQDQQERTYAQNTINNATQEVLNIVVLRSSR